MGKTYIMNDKLLFENWRKFLNERGESDLKDMMAQDAAHHDDPNWEVDDSPQLPGFERSPIASFEDSLPSGKECKGTVGEFLQYITGVHAAIKTADFRIASAKVGDPKGFIPGGENVKAAVEVAELGLASLAELTSALASTDLDNDFGVKDRSQAPFLEFCTIDDKYKALLNPIVIRNFLKSGYWMSTAAGPMDPSEPMPDIDEKLEDWIREQPEFEGVILDGVSSARDDYKKWCAKAPPTPGQIMSRYTANKIKDTGQDISAAASTAKKIGGNVWDRIASILPSGETE